MKIGCYGPTNKFFANGETLSLQVKINIGGFELISLTHDIVSRELHHTGERIENIAINHLHTLS
jgi:hypothetical protein